MTRSLSSNITFPTIKNKDFLKQAQTVLRIVVFYVGHWILAARWVSVVIRLFGVGLAYRMLTGPSLVSVSPEGLAAVLRGVPLASQQALIVWIGAAVQIAIVVTIIVSVIELAAELYRLLLKGRLPFLRVLKSR